MEKGVRGQGIQAPTWLQRWCRASPCMAKKLGTSLAFIVLFASAIATFTPSTHTTFQSKYIPFLSIEMPRQSRGSAPARRPMAAPARPAAAYVLHDGKTTSISKADTSSQTTKASTAAGSPSNYRSSSSHSSPSSSCRISGTRSLRPDGQHRSVRRPHPLAF